MFFTGIHLVPKAHALSLQKDVEWRLAFSLPEIKLARSLREEQRLCYLAVKALYFMELKEPTGLKSYHLKMILFWVCEKTPSNLWTMNSLGRGFLVLLDKLISCLREGRLPHYFVPELNLIELLKKEDLDVWVRKLEAIRSDPVNFLVRFHDRYKRLSGLTLPLNEDDALKDTNRYAKGIRLVARHSESGDDNKAFSNALLEIGFCYAVEGKFLDMTLLAAHLESLKYEVTMDEAPIMMEGHLARVKLLIRFMDALVQYVSDNEEESPSHRMMMMVKISLARLQHEAANVTESPSERDSFLTKAYAGFTKIVSSVHHDTSSALLFANFLYEQQRLEEAIIILTTIKICAHLMPAWCPFVLFNEFTAHTPDDFLKEELHARKEVEYWVPTFTLYLLISCFVDNGQTGRARDLLPELFAERDRSSKEFSYGDSCVLLGYCYLRLGEKEGALSMFKEAVDEHASDAGKYWYKKILQEDGA